LFKLSEKKIQRKVLKIKLLADNKSTIISALEEGKSMNEVAYNQRVVGFHSDIVKQIKWKESQEVVDQMTK
ncbi:hypothetical protein DOY81_015453, partial [Sarcophaga bullata]